MNDALATLSPWFKQPLPPNGTVREVMTALSAHPVFTMGNQDVPVWREVGPRRFEVFEENQGNFVVYTREPDQSDPTMYFESHLLEDWDIEPAELVDGALPIGGFQRFLWHMLGHMIVFRTEDELPDPNLSPRVKFAFGTTKVSTGVWCASELRAFADYAIWIGQGTIVIPGWARAKLK